jgi:hypothetical protein
MYGEEMKSTRAIWLFGTIIAFSLQSTSANGLQSTSVDIAKEDIKGLFSYQHMGIAMAGLGLASGVYAWDDNAEGSLEGTFLLEGPSDITNIYGSSSFNLPFSLGLWGVGKMVRSPKLADTGTLLLRTLGLAQLVVAPIKFTVRRERPDKSNLLSFPSGHTANSFAIARLLHRRHGLYVGVPFYILSGFVAGGRIEDDHHHVSDVVMGAALGIIVGNSVNFKPLDSLSIYPRNLGAVLVLHL